MARDGDARHRRHLRRQASRLGGGSFARFFTGITVALTGQNWKLTNNGTPVLDSPGSSVTGTHLQTGIPFPRGAQVGITFGTALSVDVSVRGYIW